eukprot:365094-Chlamydomonas_euryale.AAC.2
MRDFIQQESQQVLCTELEKGGEEGGEGRGWKGGDLISGVPCRLQQASQQAHPLLMAKRGQAGQFGLWCEHKQGSLGYCVNTSRAVWGMV